MAPDSSSRDGNELHFATYPQHQLSYHDSFGSHIPNNLKKQNLGGFIDISLLVKTANKLHDMRLGGGGLKLK